MANIKSAKKRIKVIETKTLQNKMVKSAYKTAVKKLETAINDGNKEQIMAAYAVAVKKIDCAAHKGIIHKNAAARHKSRFTTKINSLGA